MVLEKTLESPLDSKEIQPVHSEGDQSWVFIRRTDVEAETPVLWPPDVRIWLIWKDPDVGKDWGQEEKGMTEDEMVGWHHLLDEHGFGWTPGVGDGQGGLACCDSWGRTESDTTERLNWTELNLVSITELRNVHQILLSMYFRKELKILWLPYGWLTIQIATSSLDPTAISVTICLQCFNHWSLR